MILVKATLVLAFWVAFCSGDSNIFPYDLRVEYLRNPLAVDVPKPRLSWKLGAVLENGTIPANLSQSAYQIIAASNSSLLNGNGTADLWDTGKLNSTNQTQIPYEGKLPGPGERIYWTVRVWDQDDSESSYANESTWDVGHAKKWSALWINAPSDLQKNALNDITGDDRIVINFHSGLKPVLYFRKTFSIDAEIKRAKIYATAKGLYDLTFNDKLHHRVLAPGWTDFTKTLQYQVYDVTDLIGPNNTIGVKVGTGWYSGYLGARGLYGLYGKEEAFLLELHIELENGTKLVLETDKTWKVSTGPLIYSDLLHGELYYENRNLTGWTTYGYDDSSWKDVGTADIYQKTINFIADRGQRVVELERIKPVSITEKLPGVWIYDFGKNFAGYVEIEVGSPTLNARIQVRHAEMLGIDGNLYTNNLNTARAVDTYVLNSPSTRRKIQRPHFTYHGFRYAEITGIQGPLANVEAVRIGIAGVENNLTTDNEMVNALVKIIKNSQVSNFISVPTDSPQKDQRLGSMGFTQVFVPTAIYNRDVAAFFTKWLGDIRDAQSPTTGSFSDVSPRISDLDDGSPGWGEAGIILTWHLYRMYGDVRVIEEHYENMQLHLDNIKRTNAKLLWTNATNRNFGDRGSLENTPKEVFDTAYFAYDALLLSKMARVIGREENAKTYEKLHADISSAFVNEYVSKFDGKIRGDSQTAYLLPIAFEMLPYAQRLQAARFLADNIKRNNWRLTTGVGGINYLLPVLSDYGFNDVAFRLLQQTKSPSWAYMLSNGATSMWDDWNAVIPDIFGNRVPQPVNYNSLPYGSVGRWLYQYLVGIDTDETQVGFKKINIKPRFGDGINHAKGTYDSPQGLIVVEWWRRPTQIELHVIIPVNSEAHIDVSYNGKTHIRNVPSGLHKYNFTISN